jgi:catechol 2,3-dioxygenase-like lactoylglutathione lyase family enzyme
MISIDRFDHFVLTVADIDRTCAFYTQALGMNVERFGEGRTALRFGHQKINLHQAGHEFEPKAKKPTPGSSDLCFVAATPISEVLAHFAEHGIPVEEGPVRRTGAYGPIDSVYIRDPDANLVEVSNYRAPSLLNN